MKYLIIIFSILFCISCESRINRIPRLKEKEDREYGGQVKRIIEYECDKYWTDENPLKIVKSSCKIGIVRDFNPDEIMIKEMKWYDLNYPNDPGFTQTIKLDENGLIIEEISQQFGDFGFKTKRNYSYNQAGFETEKVVFREGEFAFREETIYDEYNCPIKEIRYDKNNEVENYYINEFDNRNRETSSLKYDNKNELDTKWIKEYNDEDDRWVVKYSYDGDGELIYKSDKIESFKTNKVGFLYSPNLPDVRFTDIEYYSSKKVKTWHFKNQDNNDVYQTYDESGKIIERKIYRDEVWQDTSTWKYREDGSVVEESESTSRIVDKSYYKKTTYYRVDFNGNWVEKYSLDSEGNVTELAMRDIEYF